MSGTSVGCVFVALILIQTYKPTLEKLEKGIQTHIVWYAKFNSAKT